MCGPSERLLVFNFDTQNCRRALNLPRLDRERIFSTFLNADAAKTFIHYAKALSAGRRFNAQVMRVCRVVYRTLIEDIKLSLGVAAVQLFPAQHRIRKLERAVLYSFRVKAAISAEVDVFKKETEESFGNLRARLVHLHRDVSLRETDLRYPRTQTRAIARSGFSLIS